MPIFMYKCDTCGRDEERWFATLAERDKHEKQDSTHVVPCKPNPARGKGAASCVGAMQRQVSASNFKVNGYCAANGYQFNGNQTVKNKGVV